MDEQFENPLKQLLLSSMVDKGYFNPNDLDPSTIRTIGDLSDSDVLKLLKEFGVKPKIAKASGGIVNLSNGGDAFLGKLVENIKNKPKLGSSVETMVDVVDALNQPEGAGTVRDTSRISNIMSGSNVKREMGPDIFEVFEKGGIKTAQINDIKNVPDINNYLDDFDGYNKAMKKYRNTALKGLSNDQIKLIKSSGFLSGYAEQMRKDILDKGVTKKGNKFVVKPKYKNVIKINKKGLPSISKSFENKYLAENFDFVFDTKATATGVKKPKVQSNIYTQIRNVAKETLNKAQQLNLDFALSQIDKLFKSSPDKAKKILANIAKGVKSGKLFLGGGPMSFLGESLAMDPEFQKGIMTDPSLASFFGVEGEPMVFKDGGNVEKMVKKENPLLDVLRSRD